MTTAGSSRLIAGCGYLGLRVAMSWQSDGHLTSAITRTEERAQQLREEGLQPVILDLASPRTDVRLPNADVVLWAVGFERHSTVAREQLWLDGLKWLIRHLPVAPSRMIYISSTSVYGLGRGETVDELTPVDPVTEGGLCCVRAEQMLREFTENAFSDTQVTVLRLAGIYGPDRLLRKVTDLKAGKPMPGKPEHCLNLIHVDDAVRIINRVQTLAEPPPVLNIASPDAVTRQEYYAHLAALVNAQPPVFEPSKAGTTGPMRGGNRQVVTRHPELVEPVIVFKDALQGLNDSVERSQFLQ